MEKFNDAEFHNHPNITPIIVNCLFGSWYTKVSVDVMKSKMNEQESELSKHAC